VINDDDEPQALELKDLEEIALNNQDHQEENKLF
jgi:hypothetical protein